MKTDPYSLPYLIYVKSVASLQSFIILLTPISITITLRYVHVPISNRVHTKSLESLGALKSTGPLQDR